MDAIKALGPKTLVASPERQLEADSDMEVVRRVQAGDVAAFDRLILKYRERVYGIIYHMTSNREDAADLKRARRQGRFVAMAAGAWASLDALGAAGLSDAAGSSRTVTSPGQLIVQLLMNTS